MGRKKNNEAFSQMYLAKALEGEVQAWVDQGWPGVTQTTIELFNYFESFVFYLQSIALKGGKQQMVTRAKSHSAVHVGN